MANEAKQGAVMEAAKKLIAVFGNAAFDCGEFREYTGESYEDLAMTAEAKKSELLQFIENAMTNAYAEGRADQAAEPQASGCDYCRNPLFASLKCPGCGRTATNGGA